MNQADTPSELRCSESALPPRTAGSTGLLTLFILVGVIAVGNHLGQFSSGQSQLNAAFIIAAVLASIAALAPLLAWTNVVLAAVLAFAIAGIAHAINSVMGLPLGHTEFTAAAGPKLFGLVPWWLPWLWACIALTARGVARLFLHSARAHSHHGFHVLGLAVLIATLTTLGLEAFATRSAGFWTPRSSAILNVSGSLALHAIIQFAATALLIDKFPRQRSRNFRPLLVWIILVTFLAASAA